MKIDPNIIIRFDGDNRYYKPGEKLSGEYSLESISGVQIKALEISVLWFTEGKGDEDMAVHAFWRLSPEQGDIIDVQNGGRYETVLPNSPLSYEGQIIKIHWCVRVRAILQRGRDILAQRIFRLGNIPAIVMAPEP
jgi:hypothetical protein